METSPDDFFVRTEEYPLSRRLFLYTKAPDAASAARAQAFVGFALGQTGQAEVGRKGFIDLLPRLSTPDYAGTRKTGGDSRGPAPDPSLQSDRVGRSTSVDHLPLSHRLLRSRHAGGSRHRPARTLAIIETIIKLGGELRPGGAIVCEPATTPLQILVLDRVDPAKNMHRYYVLAVEPTLFEDVALVREWGRIGTRGGRCTVELHPTESAAGEALEAWHIWKTRRGYRPRAG